MIIYEVGYSSGVKYMELQQYNNSNVLGDAWNPTEVESRMLDPLLFNNEVASILRNREDFLNNIEDCNYNKEDIIKASIAHSTFFDVTDKVENAFLFETVIKEFKEGSIFESSFYDSTSDVSELIINLTNLQNFSKQFIHQGFIGRLEPTETEKVFESKKLTFIEILDEYVKDMYINNESMITKEEIQLCFNFFE